MPRKGGTYVVRFWNDWAKQWEEKNVLAVNQKDAIRAVRGPKRHPYYVATSRYTARFRRIRA